MSRPLQQYSPPPPLADVLQWRTWPVVDHWGRTLLTAAVIIGLLLLTHWTTGRPHLVLLAAAALALSVARFCVPTQYEVNADGIRRWRFGRSLQIYWTDVGRYEVDSRGVMLFPYSDPRPLDALHAIYLPWRAEVKGPLLVQVHYYLDPLPEDSEQDDEEFEDVAGRDGADEVESQVAAPPSEQE